jgi:hypothetical protein
MKKLIKIIIATLLVFTPLILMYVTGEWVFIFSYIPLSIWSERVQEILEVKK